MSNVLRPADVESVIERSQELRSEVRAFLAEELAAGRFTPRADAWLTGWDESFSRRLGERGWLGMTLPTEYGGGGHSPIERFAVTEELLAASAPVAAHWIADRQSAPSILRFGTEEQRRTYLPGIARGEIYFGIGMSEPDSGSDLASVRTRGSRVDGGWRLSGTKVWTSGAHHAHAFVVLARTAPLDLQHRHDGLSQFIVDLTAPGVTIGPIRLISGEHHFNQVILDEVFVPDGRVLGEIGDGWRQVTSELAFERSGPERFLSTYPLLALLTDSVARSADGRGRRELGSLLARLTTLREMSLDVATALATGRSMDVPAALVKDLGTTFEGDVVDVARTLLEEEPDPGAADELTRILAQAILHTPGFTIRGGTNEILRGVIARGMGVR
ncbi:MULTISPECIES: acyl-CoA dehydrogenase family protein [Nocardia]|uniref:acyl-CoA dehydrogenase family protein n=1 Tax=Nocardia sp. TaxID=1821 RepID=UPI000D695539|nr:MULTISPECIES: acyl-CoA dehydrogenase family protein [Nocardia]